MSTRSLSMFVPLLALVVVLTGCAGTGGSGSGTGTVATTGALEETDLGVIEAALVADRLEAAEAAVLTPSIMASLLPETDPTATSQEITHLGRRYRAGRQGQGVVVRRGAAGCPVQIPAGIGASGTATIAGLGAQVTRLASGGFLLTRANGESFEVALPADGASTGTITENGRTWSVVFGTQAGEPLATLTNLRSGRILQILEDDTGTLTVSVQGTPAARGAWASDGTLEVSEFAGQRQYRRRHGRAV